MAGSVNKVILVGRLGRDPESKSFSNGGKIVNLRIATSESWKDKNSGERKERTEWHSVTIHDEGLCRVADQYLRKGSNVYLEGQLETRKWQDQSGQDKFSTEVVLRPFRSSLTMLDGKDSGSRGGYDQSPQKPIEGYDYEPGSKPAFNHQQPADFGEEIPFMMEWR